MTAFKRSIDRAYDVFAATRPRKIEGCDHCDHDFSLILNKDLRDISEEELFSFAGSVLYTCGSVNDFKCFLPRMLELCFAGFGFQYPQVVLKKLPRAGWRDWPPAERAAIHAIVAAALTERCEAPDFYDGAIDDVLCAAHLSEMDLTELFEIVGAHPGAITTLYFNNLDELANVRAQNAFAADGYTEELARFFRTPAAVSAIEAGWEAFGS